MMARSPSVATLHQKIPIWQLDGKTQAGFAFIKSAQKPNTIKTVKQHLLIPVSISQKGEVAKNLNL